MGGSSAPLVTRSNSKSSSDIFNQLSIGAQQSLQPMQTTTYPVGGVMLPSAPNVMATGGTPMGLQQVPMFMVPQYGVGGTGVMQPGTGIMQPGTGMMQPGTGIMQPGMGMMQPGMGMMQPGMVPAAQVSLYIYALRLFG